MNWTTAYEPRGSRATAEGRTSQTPPLGCRCAASTGAWAEATCGVGFFVARMAWRLNGSGPAQRGPESCPSALLTGFRTCPLWPATPCAPASPPPPRRPGGASGRSWLGRATNRPRWCAATSATRAFSRKTQPPASSEGMAAPRAPPQPRKGRPWASSRRSCSSGVSLDRFPDRPQPGYTSPPCLLTYELLRPAMGAVQRKPGLLHP
jgi:hypothetical protein